MKKNTRIILALDEQDATKALKLAKTLSGYLDAIKVGYPLTLSAGVGIIKKIARFNDVLCDFKLADIPNTNLLVAKELFSKGASGIILHGFTGRDSVRACIEAARATAAGKDREKEIFIVVEMSHEGALEFLRPVSDKLARLAVELGASGIIAPGTRPQRIKELRSIVGSLLILCPGIGAQGGSAVAAIKAGADYIIVGRSIYQAEVPEEAIKNIIQELKTLE